VSLVDVASSAVFVEGPEADGFLGGTAGTAGGDIVFARS
jgi:hypothetical protein